MYLISLVIASFITFSVELSEEFIGITALTIWKALF